MAALAIVVLFSQWIEASIWIAPSANVGFGPAVSTSAVCTLFVGSCWLITVLRQSRHEPKETFPNIEMELTV